MSGDYRDPYFEADGITIFHGDCIEVMAGMGAASVDAVVTDPPYGLGFMGKAWDTKSAREFEAWCEAWGREALRVAKPGAHLLAFGAPRTSHRLVAGLEDAGWEIRDTVAWLFGSGFPKSLDVSKAFDKAAGIWRGRAGAIEGQSVAMSGPGYARSDKGNPITDLSKEWQGWGTALKPAYEPVVLARKPLSGTVAATVAEHGTGALNIDACRVGTDTVETRPRVSTVHEDGRTIGSHWSGMVDTSPRTGRWPANVVLDEAAAAMLDQSTGGEPSRYFFRAFYTAKASRSEREAGLAHLEPTRRTDGRESDIEKPWLRTSERRNHHPTVKPVALMRWLVRMVTPPGGVVLDPFMGSGSTRIACQAEGARFIGIEQDAEYLAIAVSRLAQLGMALTTEGDEA